MIRAISTQLLRWLGWQIELQYERLPPKYVLIVVPHTSNWDFPIGLLARAALQLDINYVGKASLFRPPFGALFRWLGGYPVDRSRSHGYVEAVADIFEQHQRFAICITPEGTRRRVDRLRTGFYHIAKQAKVPIVMAQFDWQHKKIVISAPFHPSSDQTADFSFIESFYRGVLGKHPELSFGYRPLEEA
ncbi:MAG: acyltransferase [Bacteroidetes bacterium]|jgi:1-acyl-sn-glycerol-3-phosphate acyltransferase|nr:acyltransferase [Bacteroidota bacterium]